MSSAVKRLVFATLLTVISLVAALSWEMWPREVSGDDFRELVVESDKHAYSSWFLYRVSADHYYFEYSRPIVPLRFVVSRRELEIMNYSDGSAKIGYVFSGQFRLIAGRNPGVPASTF